MSIRSPFLFLLAFMHSGLAMADTVLSQAQAFTGTNVYAPDVMLEPQGNNASPIYKMWYGGWQGSNSRDEIYYRTSAAATVWSSPTTVLTVDDLPTGSKSWNVNDPSVTRHYNGASGAYQYTMFFTSCTKDNQSCTANCACTNSIWSAVSTNGTNWSNLQVLLSGSSNPAEPYAVFAPESDGTVWRVYFVEYSIGNLNTVKVATVNGARNATAIQTVYTRTLVGSESSLAGPSVNFIQGKWRLFLTLHSTKHSDVLMVESASNSSWSGPGTVLIANSDTSTICSTLTPAVIPDVSARNVYDLYFGSSSTRNTDGRCNVAAHASIEKWRWYR